MHKNSNHYIVSSYFEVLRARYEILKNKKGEQEGKE